MWWWLLPPLLKSNLDILVRLLSPSVTISRPIIVHKNQFTPRNTVTTLEKLTALPQIPIPVAWRGRAWSLRGLTAPFPRPCWPSSRIPSSLSVPRTLSYGRPMSLPLFMAAMRSRCGHYISALWFLSFYLSIFFIPRLISAVADWMSTILRHMMWS